ncbi:MAG: transposase [Acidiferrobacteraceae bacterium]
MPSFPSQQPRKHIRRHVREIEVVDFFNLLTGPELLETTEPSLPEHRERLYPPTVTLSMFMRQALVDGTGISMPDTEEKQAVYPQPGRQAQGVGFPLARLVGVICLATGAVLDTAMGPQASKGSSELALLRRRGAAFSPGDVMLADAFYCNYFLIATLPAAGVDVLFEQNGARITDFRRGDALGQRDHRVHWPKPKIRPDWMPSPQYAAFPDELTVREVKVDGQILVTTMLDARKVLRCLTPPMIEKELWVNLLAYHLIRLLMAQAACNAGIHPRELSFKHTVQLWTEWTSQRQGSDREAHNAILFRLIAQLKVGNRPGRIEPRTPKRRPKPYPWLKVPRAQARELVCIHGHL